MLEGCAKNEVQNAVPNRSIDLLFANSTFWKGCVRPLFGHFLQSSHFLMCFLSLESISHSVFSKNGVCFFELLGARASMLLLVIDVNHVIKMGTGIPGKYLSTAL